MFSRFKDHTRCSHQTYEVTIANNEYMSISGPASREEACNAARGSREAAEVAVGTAPEIAPTQARNMIRERNIPPRMAVRTWNS